MGRANNTSRSLQIISKAQGWDPNQIVDNHGEASILTNQKPFPTQIGSTFPREDLFKSDTAGTPGKDTSEPCPDPQADTRPLFNTPSRKSGNPTSGANPFPGMPGASSR
jgi:hypothetical protein